MYLSDNALMVMLLTFGGQHYFRSIHRIELLINKTIYLNNFNQKILASEVAQVYVLLGKMAGVQFKTERLLQENCFLVDFPANFSFSSRLIYSSGYNRKPGRTHVIHGGEDP
ncbi:hypothetical protein SAMN02745781_02398 [Vibrio gazogenes DSM 21264]|uniref:Uncharacterized protein n=1 Tax=Vibrio gazogenes DSM 21264 = NBRC 103151 TaxID=1123492 RepID=A0A1M5BXW7_VIBGA|nr:hypothetical protein SAMN02745781_02398 [Vibrio gazogenes DSM 21264] [Vibrio gazogenes DSM 21264 = NBRC 103151]SJN55643.1 hypothetical protein BQ6471_01645 [Vibrio gazogenes]